MMIALEMNKMSVSVKAAAFRLCAVSLLGFIFVRCLWNSMVS